jgi:hypothetical protein
VQTIFRATYYESASAPTQQNSQAQGQPQCEQRCALRERKQDSHAEPTIDKTDRPDCFVLAVIGWLALGPIAIAVAYLVLRWLLLRVRLPVRRPAAPAAEKQA